VTKRIALGAVLAFLAAATIPGNPSLEARWYNPRIGYGVGLGYGLSGYGLGGYGYGGYGWGGYGYGGTAGGNYLQGMSQVIRAQGQYNEQTSRAMINYEDARTKYIDNRKKWTETYFAMRDENRAKQAEKLERGRYSPEVHALAAESGVPKRLSSEAFDPITGKLAWPELLLAPEYEQTRIEVEHLLELHASAGSSDAIRLQNAVQQMIFLLRSNIRELPTNDYIAARKFLDSLAVTVRA
jgi:hypothetical protein